MTKIYLSTFTVLTLISNALVAEETFANKTKDTAPEISNVMTLIDQKNKELTELSLHIDSVNTFKQSLIQESGRVIMKAIQDGAPSVVDTLMQSPAYQKIYANLDSELQQTIEKQKKLSLEIDFLQQLAARKFVSHMLTNQTAQANILGSSSMKSAAIEMPRVNRSSRTTLILAPEQSFKVQLME